MTMTKYWETVPLGWAGALHVTVNVVTDPSGGIAERPATEPGAPIS